MRVLLRLTYVWRLLPRAMRARLASLPLLRRLLPLLRRGLIRMDAGPIEFHRNDLTALVGRKSALEIGPFTNPALRGPNIRYLDVLDKQGLIKRADAVGYPYSTAPVDIDYVSSTGDLGIVAETFDFCLSSHCIEHQPDLIHHLRQVERILVPTGRYLLIVPDKRYCFDHFIPESSIADFINARGNSVHCVKSVIEHRALITHNDAARHWAGDHGLPVYRQNIAAVSVAMSEYDNSGGAYVDVHAWQFTPQSFRDGIEALSNLGLIGLDVEKVYATPHNNFEFCAILKRRQA
ncbi:methyltransferase domain-containing protein [Mesorhizobium newzealandense]|uniref:Methyltransferase domain-containing protein n=1 Tax=Mesorhizobium newzealandense TaxID=1300302 RepID=A0ABW4UKV7_9HYPH